jgi:uncharacterized protein YjbI with pentapeptide repeats
MTPFIPDNFLARLAKKLSSSSGKDALDELSDDFGDPAFLAQYYLQPHCQLENPSNEDAGDRRPVFGMINGFLGGGDGEGDPRDRRNCLFLLGDAGTGKTSLLVMLKLAHLTALWPSHYHCELMKLGPSTMEKIRGLNTPRKTILLLDALNEDPAASADVFGRVTEILRATREFHRVILSCRTAYFPDGRQDALSRVGEFASGGLRCPTVFLSLFNNTQMDKYLKRRFRRMEEPNRKRAKSILNEMGSLRARPLLLSCVDDFIHSRCKIWNEFSTYEALVDAWLDREQRKIRTADSRVKFSKETLLDACIKMARWMQLSESRRCLSKAELAGSHLQEPEIGHVESLDCRGRSFLRRDSAGAYRFTHASIQEFLIALGVKNGLLPSGKKRMPATGLILSFLVHCDDARVEWRAFDLTLASLAGAELRGADLSRTLLVSADLAGCVFSKASFDNADLTSCEADQANFSSCSFEFTKAANASLNSTTFSDCRFTSSSLAGSVLSNATIERCKLDHTGLADTNLSNSTFAQSTISDCSFKSSRLCGAEFRDSSLANVKFDRCSLTGANFKNTSLQNVSVQSADMREAQLDAMFLNAIKAGAVQNWKTAAWDPTVAAVLKFSSKENDKNAETIEGDLGR